jgi:ferredoxin
MNTSKAFHEVLRLFFPVELTQEPVLCRTAKEYDYTFNIKAVGNTPGSPGYVVVEMWGDDANCRQALNEFRRLGIEVAPVLPRADRQYKKILRLNFPPERSNHPIMNSLTLGYGVTVNILGGSISPRREGYLTVEMSGDWSNCEDAIAFLRTMHIGVGEARDQIVHDDEACMNCGMCLALCPTEALSLNPETRLLVFSAEKCIACKRCTQICPVRAMLWQPPDDQAANGSDHDYEEKAV